MAGEIKPIPNINPSQYVQIVKANQEKELFDMQKIKSEPGEIQQKGEAKIPEASGKPSEQISERPKPANSMELLSDGLKKLADVAKTVQMDNGKAVEELMIKPEKVGEEIGKQSRLTTIFKGDLAETLRGILQKNPQNTDVKNAVVNVLRTYAVLYETLPETMPLKANQVNAAIDQLVDLLVTQPEGKDAQLKKIVNELKDLKPEILKMVDIQLGQNKEIQKESSVGKIISMLADTLENGDKNQMIKDVGSQVLRGLLTPNTLKAPMHHFVIPVQSGEMQAFGELWVRPGESEEVDENGRRKGGAGETLKMSLSINIPNVGKFHMDISVLGKQLNAAFYCPEELIEKFQGAGEVIGLAARNAGYQAGLIRVAENKKRKIEQILQESMERRWEVDARV